MKIALAQINPIAGDIPGNIALIRSAWTRAAERGADLVCFPELAVLGYPPRDLLLRDAVVRHAEAATVSLAESFRNGPAAIVGTVTRNPRPHGAPLSNAAVFMADGKIQATYAKQLLPTYDVFDERRYFAPGESSVVVTYKGRRIGLLVCEDLWHRDLVYGRERYGADPSAQLAERGVDVVVGLSASPFHGGKDVHRTALFANEAKRMGAVLVCVHQVGANDDVLFDGRSRVFDQAGNERLRLPGFESADGTVDLNNLPDALEPLPELDDAHDVRRALTMGIADYSSKTGLKQVLLGLSGGVDSALTACLAAEALGPENVWAIAMPSAFNLEMSRTDAETLAGNLGIRFSTIPIEPAYDTFLKMLEPHFGGKPFDVTEENIQARTRGLILMALSNKFGHLVLTTGNKSEVAVGYCTLYGDMNGGLAVLSDVWKTEVYDISRLYMDEGVMPARIIERPPSAELRPGQQDSDSLPPYAELDPLLKARIEQGKSAEEIIAMGHDRGRVIRILKLIDRNEYKRRQLAPGLKVTRRAFGVGWRMPIARPIDLGSELSPTT